MTSNKIKCKACGEWMGINRVVCHTCFERTFPTLSGVTYKYPEYITYDQHIRWVVESCRKKIKNDKN